MPPMPLKMLFRSQNTTSRKTKQHGYASPPKPKARESKLTKSRKYILPILLCFAFATLTLGLIYAYCVSKKHSELSAAILPSNDTASNDPAFDSSIFARQSDAGEGASYLPASSMGVNSNATRTRTPTDSASERDFTMRQFLVLVLYTATVPIASMTHVFCEMLLHIWKPALLFSRLAHIAILSIATLLIAGWATTMGFWLHCEVHGRGNQGVCPVQVRGHFMYGIHELSIAKGVIAGVIVLLYLAHVSIVISSMKAHRRVWKSSRDSSVEEYGQKKEIFVILEDGNNKTQANNNAQYIERF